MLQLHRFSSIALGLLIVTTCASSSRAQQMSGSGSEVATGDPWQQHIEALASPSFRERQLAFDALLEGGVDAVPAVVGSLALEDAETRARAMVVLERLSNLRDRTGTRLARALLEDQLNSGDEVQERRAASALARLNDGWTKEAIDQLQQFGAVIQRSNRANDEDSSGFQVHLPQSWTGGADRIDLLLKLDPIRWLSIEKSTLNDEALAPIAELTEIRKLYLGTSKITGVELNRLAALKQLEYLSLKQLPIDDEDLERLPAFSQLASLGLDQTKVSDAGLVHLRKYPRLEVLWLDHTNVTDRGLKHLQPLAGLRTVYLQGIEVHGGGLSDLAGLANLRYLSLKGAKLQPGTLKELSRLKQLETLGLDHTPVTDDQLAEIASMPELKTLWLSKTEVSDAAVVHLSSMPKLATVYLHGAKVSSDGANALRAAKPNIQVFR